MIYKLLIALIVTIFITSCNLPVPETSTESFSPDESTTETEPYTENKTTEGYTLSSFFAYGINYEYSYDGHGSEYASYSVFIDFMNQDKVQTRSITGGAQVVRVIENQGDKIVLTRLESEINFRENLLEESHEYSEILLKDPVISGTKWDIPEGRERFISETGIKVTTPLGEFEAVEVTTQPKTGDGYIILDYYAEDVGHIKTIFRSEENGEVYEVVSELAEIKENSVLTQSVKFYFPDHSQEVLISETRQIEFSTNDSTAEVFEYEFKKLPEGLEGSIISENTTVNFISRKNPETVHIDFSAELISEMNAGAAYEMMILQSIVNTLSMYYQLEKVYISVDGNPYSSGHIQINEDEYFLYSR